MAVSFILSPGIQWFDGESSTASDSVYSYEVAKELFPHVCPGLIHFTHSYLTSVFRSLKSEPFNSEFSIYFSGKAFVDKPTDHELILQLQGGSLEALGALYDRHSRLVYRTALVITGDPEAASDLLQDVYLRLYRFADRVDPQRPLEPWLYRVTANQAYTWVKRHQRWSHPLEEIAEWLSLGVKHSPQYITKQDDESKRIQAAIAKLSLPQRVVVVLYYINNLSLHEIAEALEIPEGTVKSRLHYGRRALRNHLGLDGLPVREIDYEFT